MSDHKVETENCTSTSLLPVLSEEHPLDKIPENEDQGVEGDDYIDNNPQKEDKVVQTGTSTTSLRKLILCSQNSLMRFRESSANSIKKILDEEKARGRYNLPKGRPYLLPNSKLTDSFPMEPRKTMPKTNVTTRTTSDLARRKLEAELKAAEEIAKLKENVIEKRLAYELATIEDNADCNSIKRAPIPAASPPDRRAFENDYQRRVPVPAQTPPSPASSLPLPPTPQIPPEMRERECYDYNYNRMPSNRAQFFPVSPRSSRQASPVGGRLLKTDSTSSLLNSIKNLNIMDKNFNIDSKFPAFNDSKSPTVAESSRSIQDFKCNDNDCKMAQKHTKYHQNDVAGNADSTQTRARLIWKSAVSKIKKKIKASKVPQWATQAEPPKS